MSLDVQGSNIKDIETKRNEANKALILAFFKYPSKTNLAYSKILKLEVKQTPLIQEL
jgi:hypothetical protein